jgi:hypothetical protein
MQTISGSGACYRCGKPASMAINLNANAAYGAPSLGTRVFGQLINFVPACEECHPSPLTTAFEENKRLRAALQEIADEHPYPGMGERLQEIARRALSAAVAQSAEQRLGKA